MELEQSNLTFNLMFSLSQGQHYIPAWREYSKEMLKGIKKKLAVQTTNLPWT